MRWHGWGESLQQDVRQALRALGKSPGFTAVAVLSLAVGTGANTAIFSIVDALLLRPLPVRDPGTLAVLGVPTDGGRFDPRFSGLEFRTLGEQPPAGFSSVAAMVLGSSFGPTGRDDGLTVDTNTRPAQAIFVSGGFFQMLGIQPRLGRFILPDEGRTPGADPVVVLGYSYWQSRFHGDPGVIGRTAALNGRSVTIVGVAPEGFRGPTPIVDMQAYLPLGMMTVETDGRGAFLTDPDTRELIVLGRLSAGTSLEQANAGLAVLGRSLLQHRPGHATRLPLRAWPLRPPGIVNGPNPLPTLALLFFTLAGMVFVLACLNVANLTLVRAAARGREIAVRAALGGSRARLIRHLLTESAIVALLGAAAGLGVASIALRQLTSLVAATGLPLTQAFPLNWRIFAFALGIAAVATAIIGLVPAVRASGGGLTAALRDGGRSIGGRSQRMRTAVVTAQVAGSCALLIVAGLFVHSLRNVERSDLGFDPAHVLNVRLDPGEIGFTEARARMFYDELLTRVRALPGVQSASFTTTVPLGDSAQTMEIGVPGYVPKEGETLQADYAAVSPAYFSTLRIPLLQGRDFADTDIASNAAVAIINEAMADRFWPRESPIGRTFARGGNRKQPLRIVGVVRNSRIEDPYSPFAPAFYVPIAQAFTPAQTLQVRTAGPPEAIAADLLASVRGLSPDVPVLNVRTMADAVANGDSGFFIFGVGARLTGALGLLGLALAVVGVYGVMASAVGQRTREIGLRLALGARRGTIVWLVSRHVVTILVIGLGCGMSAGIAGGRLAGDFLVGVGPTDPIAFGAALAVLSAVALAACYVPTRRALRIDPAIALRHD